MIRIDYLGFWHDDFVYVKELNYKLYDLYEVCVESIDKGYKLNRNNSNNSIES